MPDQIFIGQFSKGLRNDVTAFNVDNDAFPTLFNFYSWRQRVKRKRGTSLLGRLQRQISVANPVLFPWQFPGIPVNAGSANLLAGINETEVSYAITNITSTSTGPDDPRNAIITAPGHTFVVGDLVSVFQVKRSKNSTANINQNDYTVTKVSGNDVRINFLISPETFEYVLPVLPATSNGIIFIGNATSIAPGTLSLIVAGNTYTDPNEDGTLLKNGVSDPGSTVNYSNGTVTFAGVGGSTLTGRFDYYPTQPVMGLRDFTPPLPNVTAVGDSEFPLLLAFDIQYSYQIAQSSSSNNFYSTSYYKVTNNPVTWSGQDYQQFWTTNYSGALWATNNNPGMHFVNGKINTADGTSKIINFNFKSNSTNFTILQVGDVLWFNEWILSTDLNGKTGMVSSNADAANGNYDVTFTEFITFKNNDTGIAQLLTNSLSNQNANEIDGIRWYDGDPTAGTGIPKNPIQPYGWVNFAPPLTASVVEIDSTPEKLYYLVGALAILPFKDRLLFFSPYIQTSNGETPIQLVDTVLWSWNGTPYYTVDASGNPSVVPINQTADLKAWYVDQTGLGGYLPAGISQPIRTVSNNEDAIIIGFSGNGRKTRFVYTGNDLDPFLFFNINNEFPSSCTFSSINMDKGVLDIGPYGLTITDQQSCERLDLDIPDEIFRIQKQNQGTERVNAIRDYFREWIYFSYPVNNSTIADNSTELNSVYPTQTLLYNYQDNTWAIFYENFTTHGRYRAQQKRSWTTLPFKSWETWREAWNTGQNSPLTVQIIAGNPQGFVLIKGDGTGEAPSGAIASISDNGNGFAEITSNNHCVSGANPNTGVGDYLFIQGALGTTDINNQIVQVTKVIDENTFDVDFPTPAGTYLGLGTFTRLSQPILQTKQFPFYWQEGRQTRLCAQKYLMDTTNGSQVTVNIYLSQDEDTAWNNPVNSGTPNALIYSQLLYTCPESTNLGLTPSNVNLQMPTAISQSQIWHRLNTSLQGDTVQIGITLSDEQMRNLSFATDEIVLHGMQLTIDRGPLLS